HGLCPAQAGRRRPRGRRRPAARHGRGAHGRLDGRRGPASHPHRGPRDVLVPQPRGVLAQGRHVGARPVRQGREPRLRRRRAARARRPGGGRVPHRDAHVLRGGRRPGRRGRVAAGGGPMTAPATDPEAAQKPVAAPADLAWGTTWPDLAGFREMATDRRVIPVVRPVLADDATPVGLYRTLAGSRPGSFILESAESDGVWARWSFVGVASRATLTSSAGQAVWSGDVPVGIPREGDVIDVLEAALDALRTPGVANLPPLTGGLAGVLGWDVVRHWEPTLPATAPDEVGAPELA